MLKVVIMSMPTKAAVTSAKSDRGDKILSSAMKLLIFLRIMYSYIYMKNPTLSQPCIWDLTVLIHHEMHDL